nr:uncharacterized protein LOC105338080 [Crassostrea gigas]
MCASELFHLKRTMTYIERIIITVQVFSYLGQAYGLENLALRKPTWENNPWPDNENFKTANAVDGKYTDRTAGGGQCTISDDGKHTAEWRVDLGSVVSIRRIDIYYRIERINTNKFISRMAGFFLYVSNTTLKKDGHLCFHEIQTAPGTPLPDQKINCSVLGRYVIYYNDRLPNITYPSYYSQSAFNELCEVEVYGCNRTFGDNCSNHCPFNCLYGQCHLLTGQCYSCVPGYQGQDCNQECENGKYGFNCENNCGHCQQNTQCHNVNGSCLQCCFPGYIGPSCNLSCSKTFYGLNCLQQCSANCVNQTCHHESGTCQSIDASKSDKVKQVYIIGGVVGVVIVFSLIFGILILYKRNGCVTWKRGKDTTFNNSEAVAQSSPDTAFNLSNIYQNIQIDDTATARGNEKTADDDNDVDIDEKIHNENPYGDVYQNEKTIPYVDVGNLGNDIIEKSKSENDGFKKEYATLLYGERYPCNVAKRTENIPRNRFKTTFPYDHSRVVLVSANTDYINANYIDGLNREKQYIAAQGPKPNTVSDFWCMVWQGDVNQIIMLTNLKEGRKLKCAQNWPDQNATMTCENVVLTAMEERHYAYYVVRKIKMTHKKVSQTTSIFQ